MKEWEYKIYMITAPGKCLAFNGNALDSSRGELSLNEIGTDGWELVTIYNGTLYFKRQILDYV